MSNIQTPSARKTRMSEALKADQPQPTEQPTQPDAAEKGRGSRQDDRVPMTVKLPRRSYRQMAQLAAALSGPDGTWSKQDLFVAALDQLFERYGYEPCSGSKSLPSDLPE